MSNNAKRYQKGARPMAVNPRRQVNFSSSTKPVADENFYAFTMRLWKEVNRHTITCMHCGCLLSGNWPLRGGWGKTSDRAPKRSRSEGYSSPNGYHCSDPIQCRRNRDGQPSLLWRQRRAPKEDVDS